MIIALQLLGFDIHGVGQFLWWAEPGPNQWTQDGHIALPETGSINQITPSGLERAVAIARKIPEDTLDAPTNRAGIALHRFHAAMSTRGPDALIDFAIALEALLLPNTSLELSFKFALNGARLLAPDKSQRTDIYRRLRKLYSARSNLVHGTHLSNVDAQAATSDACKFARQGLLFAVEDHWPSKEDYEREALS